MTPNQDAKFSSIIEGKEAIFVLPTRVSIKDSYNLFLAIKEQNVNQFELLVAGIKINDVIEDSYSVYNFDSDRFLDELEGQITQRTRENCIYWGVDQTFVLVCGTRGFCETAVPYPIDIQRHYYIEAMTSQLSDEEAQQIYDSLVRA